MKVLKAQVMTGRYKDQMVRISNISTDDIGRKKAACILADGTRANIPLEELEIIPEKPETEIKKAKTASMPFLSGSTSSRSLTHTRNMHQRKIAAEQPLPATTKLLATSICQQCGGEFNPELRKGRPGKITECMNCAEEVVSRSQGSMIYSHKTGATIEIKKDGELLHAADTFDPKNKI
jgi:hypothetical protein